MNREQLRSQIVEAFKPAQQPKAEEISNERHCDECRGLAKALRNRKWYEVPPEIVDANHDKLPLLSPIAFRYFLPAYMLRSLDAPGGSTWQFTFYALTPKGTDWLLPNVELLTKSQMEAIIAFLDFQTLEFDEVGWPLATEKVLLRKIKVWLDLIEKKC